MSFKSLYSIQKETNVTQGINSLKYMTSSGCYMTAVLGNVTFRNLCKALQVLVQTLLPKQLPKTPTSRPATLTSATLVFTGHTPVPGGAWHMLGHVGGKSRDDDMSHTENCPLSLSLASVTLQVPCPPAVPLHPCGTITSGCATSFLSFCPWLPPAARYRQHSGSTAISRGISPDKWLCWQPRAHPRCSAVWSPLCLDRGVSLSPSVSATRNNTNRWKSPAEP